MEPTTAIGWLEHLNQLYDEWEEDKKAGVPERKDYRAVSSWGIAQYVKASAKDRKED